MSPPLIESDVPVLVEPFHCAAKCEWRVPEKPFGSHCSIMSIIRGEVTEHRPSKLVSTQDMDCFPRL